jgi:hypothetical protein
VIVQDWWQPGSLPARLSVLSSASSAANQPITIVFFFWAQHEEKDSHPFRLHPSSTRCCIEMKRKILIFAVFILYLPGEV